MIPLTDLTELQRAAYEWADNNDPDKSHLAKVGEASCLAIFIEKRIGMALDGFIEVQYNPMVAEKNKRIAELEAELEDKKRLHIGELLSKDKHINAFTDRSVQLALELKKVERLGARLAAVVFNVRQESFKITEHDRKVMGELVSKWDKR